MHDGSTEKISQTSQLKDWNSLKAFLTIHNHICGWKSRQGSGSGFFMCCVSCLMCHLLLITCHLSLMPTATATTLLSLKSPSIHSRLVHKDLNTWKTFKQTTNCQHLFGKNYLLANISHQSRWKRDFQERTNNRRTSRLVDLINLGTNLVLLLQNR